MFKRIKEWLAGERTVYKVIWKATNESCVVEGMAAVKYKQGMWVSAPDWLAKQGYWLTCFETFAQASQFKCNEVLFAVWECRAREIKRQLPQVYEPLNLSRGRMLYPGDQWPKGTIMAKQLKLVKLCANSGR